MTATLPNRIASHSSPATPSECQEAWTRAVFAAVRTLEAQLRHADPVLSQQAALAILDLEKTRLRHDRPVTGTEMPAKSTDVPREEIPSPPPPPPPVEPNDDEASPLLKPMTYESQRDNPEFQALVRDLRAKMRHSHPDQDWTDEVVGHLLIRRTNELLSERARANPPPGRTVSVK